MRKINFDFMKHKTIEKLFKKLARLPLLHIDASVILEPEKTEDGYYCKKLLNIVGTNYRGRISLIVLGELFLDTLGLKDYSERQDAIELIFSLMSKKKIEYGIISRSDDEIAIKISNIDSRIDQADRLILACAIEDDTDYFVTLDKKLIGNEVLEKEFNTRIVHPKNLI